MKLSFVTAALAALVVVPGLAAPQELTADQKQERAYAEFEAARRSCHLAPTGKWDRYVAEMQAVEAALGQDEVMAQREQGAAMFERKSQARGLEAACDLYVGSGWLSQTLASPAFASTSTSAQVHYAAPGDQGTSAFTCILLVGLAVYGLISGIIVLPVVRPRFMH